MAPNRKGQNCVQMGSPWPQCLRNEITDFCHKGVWGEGKRKEEHVSGMNELNHVAAVTIKKEKKGENALTGTPSRTSTPPRPL